MEEALDRLFAHWKGTAQSTEMWKICCSLTRVLPSYLEGITLQQVINAPKKHRQRVMDAIDRGMEDDKAIGRMMLQLLSLVNKEIGNG